jgi:hypothetical protein
MIGKKDRLSIACSVEYFNFSASIAKGLLGILNTGLIGGMSLSVEIL